MSQLKNKSQLIILVYPFIFTGEELRYDYGFSHAEWRRNPQAPGTKSNIDNIESADSKNKISHKVDEPFITVTRKKKLETLFKYSLGHTYTSRMDPSIREEFDFTAGISNYLLMTEQEAQTNGHQDFTGTSVFYFLLKGRKEFFIVEPTQQRFDEWRESEWKKFVKRKTHILLQFTLKILIYFLIVKL